jgi:hypothetical protein
MADFLQDNNGDNSSKRLWGSILLGVGIILKVTLFFLAIKFTVKNPDLASNVIEGFFYIGGSLLGLGVFEGVVKK